MEMRKADVVIIGGGASGLAAAAELGMEAPQLDVLVIEKLPEPGRKIRATGSGRCNITNTGAEGYSRIMSFFREIGLVTRTCGNGLVYPYSESAADVAELLTERAVSLGVKIACGEEVTSVEAGKSGGRYSVGSVFKDRDGEKHVVTEADFVVLACGGKAGPSYGTTGDGYRLAKKLGHSIVPPAPALAGVECREWDEGREPRAITLAGTRSRGIASLYRDPCGSFGEDSKIFEESGEIQFTKYGLSGICVFNMTRFMRFDRSEGESLDDFIIRLDLFPDGDMREYIRDRQAGMFSGLCAGDLLRTILKEPFAEYITAEAAAASGAPDLAVMPVSKLGDREAGAIAACVHSLGFRPSGIRGWKEAQVTMGGVSADEINEETSESKLAEGLYITGELADRDFMCGGYNLSNAWITGLAAADDIAAK